MLHFIYAMPAWCPLTPERPISHRFIVHFVSRNRRQQGRLEEPQSSTSQIKMHASSSIPLPSCQTPSGHSCIALLHRSVQHHLEPAQLEAAGQQ
jgi:hypothetical protein